VEEFTDVAEGGNEANEKAERRLGLFLILLGNTGVG
jgi:hypothetical protein